MNKIIAAIIAASIATANADDIYFEFGIDKTTAPAETAMFRMWYFHLQENVNDRPTGCSVYWYLNGEWTKGYIGNSWWLGSKDPTYITYYECVDAQTNGVAGLIVRGEMPTLNAKGDASLSKDAPKKLRKLLNEWTAARMPTPKQSGLVITVK